MDASEDSTKAVGKSVEEQLALMTLRAEQEKQRAEQAEQRAEQEKQRAEQEKQRAEQEKQRAEQEKQRAEQEKQLVRVSKYLYETISERQKYLVDGLDHNHSTGHQSDHMAASRGASANMRTPEKGKSEFVHDFSFEADGMEINTSSLKEHDAFKAFMSALKKLRAKDKVDELTDVHPLLGALRELVASVLKEKHGSYVECEDKLHGSTTRRPDAMFFEPRDTDRSPWHTVPPNGVCTRATLATLFTLETFHRAS